MELSKYKPTNQRYKLFVETYLSDPNRNATNAYLKVYPNVSPDTAQVNSSKLLSLTKIRDEIARRNEQLEKKTEITKELITNQLQEDRLQAKELNQMSPAVKVSEILAKMNGYLIEKSLNVNVSLEDFLSKMKGEAPEDA